MRLWLVSSTLAVAAFATARPAAAQESQLNGGTIKVELYIPEDNGENGKARSTSEDDYMLVNPDAELAAEMRRYFNHARCVCDRESPGMQAAETSQLFMLKLTYGVSPMPRPSDVPLEVFAGTSCADNTNTETRDRNCSRLGSLDTSDLNTDNVENIFAQVGDLMAAGTTADGDPNECNPTELSKDVFVTSGATQRFNESGEPFAIPFDMRAPEMPAEVRAVGLEKTIRVSWDAPTTAPTYYQALCVREDGSPAHSITEGATANPTSSPRFDTTDHLCDLPAAEPLPASLDGDETPVGELPAPLKQLDRSYVCGESGGTTNSIDLKDLENDASYWIVVLAIDDAGNYDARYLPRVVRPAPSIDFWEDLNAERPEVDGGFCVAQVSRSGGSAASALLVLGAIGLVARRRRRRQAGRAAGAAALTTLAVLALAPGAARAQSWDPYWDESEAEASGAISEPRWRVGLRVGPYYPAVDEGFTSDPGPYRRMFGPGYNLVPQLDLHRVWSLPAIQLGFGMSGGYYAKSADAYMNGTTADDPGRPRAEGATNTFKMVPLSATGIARLTVLDDRWRIPLVPYVRGGVAYNIWWVRTATGELARTCDTCEDKAFGASAGLVGAVGLSLRGERLDQDSLHSMQAGGIEHAGFYAELETSWVDGFGNEKRLSLGDTTWFAGVDFEF